MLQYIIIFQVNAQHKSGYNGIQFLVWLNEHLRSALIGIRIGRIMRFRIMKHVLNGSMMSHAEGLGTLNKDMQSVWLRTQKFSFYCKKNIFDKTWAKRVSKVKYFIELSTDFDKKKVSNESLSLQLLFLPVKKF